MGLAGLKGDILDYLNAINERVSRRSFLKDPVEDEILEELQSLAARCNEKGGLHISVEYDDEGAFNVAGSKGMLTGAKMYFLLAGPESDENLEEKLGYFGEILVLRAVSLGLGTCWIHGTFDREKVMPKLMDGDAMHCCVVFGNVRPQMTAKELMVSKSLKRNSKRIKDMLFSEEQPPNWVIAGVRAAVRAPSARNRQGVKFLCSSDVVSAKVGNKYETDLYDLGIAKLHFEVGAGLGEGKWNFGNGAVYERRPEK